jgi:hypothetical protein
MLLCICRNLSNADILAYMPRSETYPIGIPRDHHPFLTDAGECDGWV